MNRSFLPLAALAGLIALTGCAELGYASGRYGDYGDYRRAPVPTHHDGYGRTSPYRGNVERDARLYVDQLDRHLRISNREEREIRNLLIRRTYQLLDRTAYSRHGSVYPFPRHYGEARGWWAQIDRDIERILDRRYREPYRYYNRYGSTRYYDYYRHRRYDVRRGWYDTRRTDRRYRDGRRYEQERRAAERRAEERRRDRRADRRDDRRDRRDDRIDHRRDQREDARERRDDRRRDARRDRDRDRQRTDRRQDRRQETRRDRDRDRQRTERRQESRRDRSRDRQRTERRQDRRESSRASDRRRASREADRNRDRTERPTRRRGNND